MFTVGVFSHKKLVLQLHVQSRPATAHIVRQLHVHPNPQLGQMRQMMVGFFFITEQTTFMIQLLSLSEVISSEQLITRLATKNLSKGIDFFFRRIQMYQVTFTKVDPHTKNLL